MRGGLPDLLKIACAPNIPDGGILQPGDLQVPGPTQDVYGQVWHDKNGDGMHDIGEMPIAGITLRLDACQYDFIPGYGYCWYTCTGVGSTVSDNTGNFHFIALPALA